MPGLVVGLSLGLVSLFAWSIFLALPHRTMNQPGTWFGVPVAAEFLSSARAQTIARMFRATVSVHACAAFAGVVLSVVSNQPGFAIVGVLWLGAAGVVAVRCAVAKIHRAQQHAALAPSSEQLDQSRFMKLGLFYSNPDDPRRWVPRSVGIGYMPNLAHHRWMPVFILFVGVLIVASIVVAFAMGR